MIDYRVQTFPKPGFVFVSFWTYFIEYVKRIRSKFWQPTRSSPDMLKSVMQVKEKWKKKWASSHTPRCNIARECCTLCIPLLWKVVLVNQVVNHKWILVIKDTHNGLTVVSLSLAKLFLSSKRSKLREKKIETKFPVDMHIYMVCPSQLQSFRKFCWAVSE